MLSFLRLSFIPASVDFGLLILRIISGGAMFWLHGKDKWGNMTKDFPAMAEKFGKMVPLLNGQVSAGLVVFAEVVCALMLVLGLFTRFAALALAITMAVAFFKIHEMKLSGPGSGELALMYLMAYTTLFFTGAGKLSIDGNIGGGEKA